MEFFDSHAHYNDEIFDKDREVVLDRLYNEDNITRIVCAGYNLKKSKYAVELAKTHHFLYSTVGISPNDLEDFSSKNLQEIENLTRESKVVALGEIGLDYYWNKDNKDIQKSAFISQIEIANKACLPIVIHNRDAYIDTIQILKDYPVKKIGVFHCCQLNQELIKDALKLGFYISFSGNITFKSAKSAECVRLVPLDKFLIETDSPYLTPEPYRGTRNDSSKVKLVAQKIAEIKGLSIEEIARFSYENANNVFGI